MGSTSKGKDWNNIVGRLFKKDYFLGSILRVYKDIIYTKRDIINTYEKLFQYSKFVFCYLFNDTTLPNLYGLIRLTDNLQRNISMNHLPVLLLLRHKISVILVRKIMKPPETNSLFRIIRVNWKLYAILIQIYILYIKICFGCYFLV